MKRVTKSLPMIAFAIVQAMLPATANETVPYAWRAPKIGETYVPGLGDIMQAIQWRHIKLSYAGKLGNWRLADYELGQMLESLSNAAQLYQNIPIEKIIMVDQPLIALSDAIKAKSSPRFTRVFADLTETCNNCHTAAQVGFITIQVPTASPFSDLQFQTKAR